MVYIFQEVNDMFKKMKSYLAMALTIFILACSIIPQMPVQAADWMNVGTSVNTKYQITLKWKKKSVTKYVIYRQTYNQKTGNVGKSKKLATISGKKTSYTDKKTKKNTYYIYTVKAYKNKKLKYHGESSATCAGLAGIFFDDYFFAECKISPTSIRLVGYCDAGIAPDGFKIYRSSKGGSYKLIKTIKNKKRTYSFKYTDKSVKGGTKYKYKIRAFRTINKKTVYGPYSQVVTKSAVHMCGKYTAEFICPDKDADGMATSLIVKLTPKDAYNGDISMGNTGATLLFGKNGLSYDQYGSYDETDPDIQGVYLPCTAYSYDGLAWTKFPGTTVVLSGKKTVYLKFEAYYKIFAPVDEYEIVGTSQYEYRPFKYNPEDYEEARLVGFELGYNTYIPSFLEMNLKTGSTSMYFNAEAIH